MLAERSRSMPVCFPRRKVDILALSLDGSFSWGGKGKLSVAFELESDSVGSCRGPATSFTVYRGHLILHTVAPLNKGEEQPHQLAA